MATLNKAAAETMLSVGGAHACTDITGFGLIGHASEMAAASGVTIEIAASAVPLLEGVLPLTSRNRSGGMATNRNHFGTRIQMADAIGRDLQDLLFDPQTSGGLLISVDPAVAEVMARSLQVAGVDARMVGRVGLRAEDGQLVSVV